MEEQRATLEDAIILAAQSHRGQKDKAGAPYITHPLRVLGFLGVGASEDEQITAVLHDVVEDCGVSFEDLTRAGYSTEVIEALRCVTKLPHEADDYEAFVARLAPNPTARRVKLADLQDNMNLARIPAPSDKDRARLERYRKAEVFLRGWTP